jgi:LuxR family transcriptional regulator, maltose regulon positive regulatory protein
VELRAAADGARNVLPDVPSETKAVTADASPVIALETKGQGTTEKGSQHTRPSIQSDPLLTTKLHRPRPRSRLVSRSSLVERLQQAMERPLTLISAPAGFGKTTLLTQWLAESSTPAAWLSLEPEDNDPIRFLTYLIAALQTVDAQLGTTALELLRSAQPPSTETLVALLTNDLMLAPVDDFALVLDDYHAITVGAIHRALTFFIEHLPPPLHLVIATRADPPLPLSRLRARGQLAEVRATDLRFSSEEASAFLHTFMGLNLQPEHLAILERQTEGWIAGLQLAALSLQGRSDVSAFLSAFSGSHRFVLDYLSDEVFFRQPDPVQSFLLHTSILERLCGSLCDAITGQEGSQSILEALEKANLFVVSLDEERLWYRYHHLFAEVLNNRLQRTEPALVPDLHRRASSWYEAHSFVVEAVQHALVAADLEHAAHLIEHHGITIVFSGQHYTLLDWMDKLPEALVRARPLLALIHAAVLILVRQFERAESYLKEAENSVNANAPVESARLILGWAAQCRAELANYSSADLVASIEHARRALTLLPETEEAIPIRAVAYYYISRSVQINGDVTPATERLMVAGTEALNVLHRALTLAAPEGYIRLFVDEGAPMHLLLRDAQARGIVPKYVATLLAVFGEPTAPRPPSEVSSLVEPLTEREREILRLLLEGTSNREIAQRLVLSINTVKRHIYNICGKLGVQSRTQAIVKARALDLS